MKFKSFVLSFLFLLSFNGIGKDDLVISILTCSSGEEVYSIFGHNAIRVQDNVNKTDYVYDYGIFNFNEPNFVWKFLSGELRYHVAKEDFIGFLKGYVNEDRAITEQELKLSETSKKALLQALEENILPENKHYQYDFLEDNCSTRLRDLIIRLGDVNPLDHDPSETNRTFRENINDHLQYHPWLKFGTDLLLGQTVDRQMTVAEDLFLPLRLSLKLENMTLNNGDLLAPEKKVLTTSVEEVKSSEGMINPWWIFLSVLLIQLLSIVFMPKLANILFYCFSALFGILSLILIYMWFLSVHEVCVLNWNLLWISPLYLIALVKKSPLLLKVIIGLNVICLAGWIIIPQDLNEMAIPLIVGMVALHFNAYCKKAKALPKITK